MDPAAPVPPALAAALLALPPSLGPVRLVAVDGHAGSGKTTLAGRLSAALGGAPVVHLDNLATHREPFGWTERLRAQVLEPLARGAAGRHAVYDWSAGAFGGDREVPVAPVVLLEGVGAGRRAVRPHLAALLWMELDQAAARAAGSCGTVRNWPSSGRVGRVRNRRTSRPIRAVRTPTSGSTGSPGESFGAP